MRDLLVLYDSSCAFCEWCRVWLESRPQRVRLRFVCCRSAWAREHFGALPLGAELVVVDPEGRYWMGAPGFVMCLWALEDYAEVSMSLGEHEGVSRLTFGWISDHRGWLGQLLGAPCDGACEAPLAPAAPYR